MPSAFEHWTQGGGEGPQFGVAIRGPREEEFGARLSDVPYMNSTDLVGNPEVNMSAMRFCMARFCSGQKKWLRSRGERSHRRVGPKPVGGNAARCKGGGETVAL